MGYKIGAYLNKFDSHHVNLVTYSLGNILMRKHIVLIFSLYLDQFVIFLKLKSICLLKNLKFIHKIS